MNNQIQSFLKKIQEIHGLTPDFNPLMSPQSCKKINPQNATPFCFKPSMKKHHSTKEIRHNEFQALTEAFLGKHYDQEKLRLVEQEQTNLDDLRSQLIKKYKSKKLTPEDYVDQVNRLILETFKKIEKILGAKDFLKLFAADPEHAGGYIDKDLFLSRDLKE